MVRKSTGKRNRRKKDQRRQLLIVAVVSLLFFACLLTDCYKKGLFQIGKEQEKQREVLREKQAEKDRDQTPIRVLLSNTEQSSIFHEQVIVSGNKEVTVEQGGKEISYDAGEKIVFDRKRVKEASKGILLTCSGGRLKVNSIRRRQQVPAYRGTLRLIWNVQGILIINELPLGQYLYSVLPSEMSSDYPMEALKAQAVCARSFAWRQMKSEKYKEYGADVDDTTAFQVYRMGREDARTRKAVQETAGEMLFHGKTVVTAYYYSTSWGSSATVKEVWGGEGNPCYPRKLQITEESQRDTGITELDLSDEKIFQALITQPLYETYDQESSWYRWEVQVTAKELGASMGLEPVQGIQILKREKSGLVSKIRVLAKNGRRTITGQQNIREALLPTGEYVEKGDGSRTQPSMLPSAAFVIYAAVNEDGTWYRLVGGGFGHGVGMSQNGAAGMAKAGKDYQEILSHYYHHCKIK